jgi:hypothetical protein
MGFWLDIAAAVVAVGVAGFWFLSTRRRSVIKSPSSDVDEELRRTRRTGRNGRHGL